MLAILHLQSNLPRSTKQIAFSIIIKPQVASTSLTVAHPKVQAQTGTSV